MSTELDDKRRQVTKLQNKIARMRKQLHGHQDVAFRQFASAAITALLPTSDDDDATVERAFDVASLMLEAWLGFEPEREESFEAHHADAIARKRERTGGNL